MGVLLYREQIVCGVIAVKGAMCVWDCCCRGSKLCVGLLLYREQIGCASAAVQGANLFWDCCCKGSKMCWSGAVKGVNCLGDYC